MKTLVTVALIAAVLFLSVAAAIVFGVVGVWKAYRQQTEPFAELRRRAITSYRKEHPTPQRGGGVFSVRWRSALREHSATGIMVTDRLRNSRRHGCGRLVMVEGTPLGTATHAPSAVASPGEAA